MRLAALTVLVCVVVWFFSALVAVLRMDEGPDWLVGLCIFLSWLAVAIGVVAIIILVVLALGIQVSVDVS